jgi:hypothetical protein
LPLIATISVVISDAVRSVSGAALSEPFTAGFVVRDGMFGPPRKLTDYTGLSHFSSNDRGDLLIVANTALGIEVLNFHAAHDRWEGPTLLDTPRSEYFSLAAALDEAGNALAMLDGGDSVDWVRYTPDRGWSTVRTLSLWRYPLVAFTLNGVGVATYHTAEGALAGSTIVPTANAWSAAQELAFRAGLPQTFPTMEGVVSAYHDVGTETVYARVFIPGSGWGVPFAIGGIGGGMNFPSYDARDGAAILVWHETEALRSRMFDGSRWLPLANIGIPTEYTSCAIGWPHAVAAWTEPDGTGDLQVVTRRFIDSTGWQEATVLGPASVGNNIAAAIDPNGAATVAWPDDDAIVYRRQSLGQNWTAPARLVGAPSERTFDVRAADTSTGEITLVWRTVSGLWAASKH